MNKSLPLSLLILALCQAVFAADPAAPMADLEPQLTQSAATPSAASSSSPSAGAMLDDFAFGAQTTPSPPTSPGAVGRDDEYRSAPQPIPVLEGF